MKLSELMGTKHDEPSNYALLVDGNEIKIGDTIREIGVDMPCNHKEPAMHGTGYIEYKYPTQEEIKDRIKAYNPAIINGYIYMGFECSVNMSDLYHMISLLSALGCTDIQDMTEERLYTGGLKCTRFFVRGKIPEGFEL